MEQRKQIATFFSAGDACGFRIILLSLLRQTENLEQALGQFAAALGELRTKEALPSLEFGIDFYQAVRSYEIALIRQALEASRSQLEAAALLKLRPSTLSMKIKRYELVAYRGACKKL